MVVCASHIVCTSIPLMSTLCSASLPYPSPPLSSLTLALRIAPQAPANLVSARSQPQAAVAVMANQLDLGYGPGGGVLAGLRAVRAGGRGTRVVCCVVAWLIVCRVRLACHVPPLIPLLVVPIPPPVYPPHHPPSVAPLPLDLDDDDGAPKQTAGKSTETGKR